MSIISFFNSVLSGQKSKSRIIEGFEVSYRYSGKGVLFDPITMLRDLKYKLESNQVTTGELCVSLGEIVDQQLNFNDQLVPTVEAKFKIENEYLKVQRYVMTFESIPCSWYDFFLDQIPLCTFQRRYDYGKDFEMIKEKFASFTSNQPSPMSNYWENRQNEGLFLEHFGHTQIWVLHSVSGLKQVWNKLGN
ncbi:hypothetical protein [Algoriphagus sp. A40]|uniref:hypothetical protein n=1 Tax=Algoriphagus sp. A40 TaxID=1945863 RepID=UPI0009857F71|nr:hypothetical protein [Algoriphagus sp. A40]OOG68930.1 hypothetical protein B0E43_21875 [Algoriphagus sp. A40]